MVTQILIPEHRLVVTRCAEDRMIWRLRRVDVMYLLYRIKRRRRYVWSCRQDLQASVRADDDPEKAIRSLELVSMAQPRAGGKLSMSVNHRFGFAMVARNKRLWMGSGIH